MSKQFKKGFKAFILRSDLFAAAATLRYKGEPAYETLCGGIFSIILVIFFVVVFASQFIEILNKLEIEAKTEVNVIVV